MTRLPVLPLMLTAIVSGCGAVASIHPLYTESDLATPIVDPRVEGEWISPDLDTSGVDDPSSISFHWTITRRPAFEYYTVAVSDTPRSEMDRTVSIFDGRLVSIGEALFFDAEFSAEMKGETVVRASKAPLLVATHAVGRIWVQEDFLRLALLDPDWVQAHAAERMWISYANKWEDDVLITASTEELREFLVQHADDREAFARMFYLCRPGTDCAPRAMDDLLRSSPDDDDTLFNAARLFSARGNHARAIELRRHRAELKPDDRSVRVDLGDEYLLAGDFSAARREFVAAKALAAPASETVETKATAARVAGGMIWSHYLEGRYGEVVGAARAFTPPYASAEPILLSYFSLIRLGRRTEAASLLRHQVATFIGSDHDMLLLLRAQAGRMLAVATFSTSEVERERAAFFGGLQELAAGHLDSARSHLQVEALTTRDSVLALAARIELARLGPTPNK